MNKIIAAFAIVGLTYGGAQAQTVQACGSKSDKVCRLTANKNVSCYKTKYAENYKVCKGNSGYFICCETPNATNSTHSGYVIADNQPEEKNYDYPVYAVNTPVNMTAPQSQSYVVANDNSYEAYYPKKGVIKVCYTGDNVAEENRAPYEGCPSPASDGPDANRQRNLNVSNPAPMPPSSGQPF